MIESNTIEGSRNAIYYATEFRFVTDLSSDIAATIDGLGQAWYRIPVQGIENIIMTALKINYLLNNRSQLISDKRHTPDSEIINIMQSCLLVPRFVRDAIREIIRPMHHSGITYLPDINLEMKPTPKLLDMFYEITPHLTRWNNVCNKLGYELVPILPEALASVSLTFYSYETDEILSFDNIVQLDWRLEAFGRTRHLLYQPKSAEDVCVNSLSNSSKRKVTQEVNHEIDEPKVYERNIRNRRILGMLVYRYTCTPYPLRLGHIGSTYRFPTEEKHSKTPPQTRRIVKEKRTKELKNADN